VPRDSYPVTWGRPCLPPSRSRAAGIVADSVPAQEYEEAMNKARAMLKAFEMAEKGL